MEYTTIAIKEKIKSLSEQNRFSHNDLTNSSSDTGSSDLAEVMNGIDSSRYNTLTNITSAQDISQLHSFLSGNKRIYHACPTNKLYPVTKTSMIVHLLTTAKYTIKSRETK